MINENNYETYFMSYIDNELNAAERAAVEAFVLTEPKYAEELAHFEKAKLQAPSVEMEDKIFLYRFPEMDAKLDPDFKNSLYRKEAPVRKIIFTPNMMRASFAIAAMLILLIGLQLFKSDTNILESNALKSNELESNALESNVVELALKDKTALAITNNSSTNSKQAENTILPKGMNKVAISNKINNINITIAKSATTNQASFEDQTIVTNNMNTNIISSSSSQASSENDSQSILVAKFNEAQISSNSMVSAGANADYIFEPEREEILSELLPKSIKIQFFKAILESNAAEHGARMTAMDKASENANELLKTLKISYNRARQAAITTELTEIVSGAAALNG
jgi:hypothetical protein